MLRSIASNSHHEQRLLNPTPSLVISVAQSVKYSFTAVTEGFCNTTLSEEKLKGKSITQPYNGKETLVLQSSSTKFTGWMFHSGDYRDLLTSLCGGMKRACGGREHFLHQSYSHSQAIPSKQMIQKMKRYFGSRAYTNILFARTAGHFIQIALFRVHIVSKHL